MDFDIVLYRIFSPSQCPTAAAHSFLTLHISEVKRRISLQQQQQQQQQQRQHGGAGDDSHHRDGGPAGGGEGQAALGLGRAEASDGSPQVGEGGEGGGEGPVLWGEAYRGGRGERRGSIEPVHMSGTSTKENLHYHLGRG